MAMEEVNGGGLWKMNFKHFAHALIFCLGSAAAAGPANATGQPQRSKPPHISHTYEAWDATAPLQSFFKMEHSETTAELVASQTPDGFELVVRTKSLCVVRARYSILRTVYTGVVSCTLTKPDRLEITKRPEGHELRKERGKSRKMFELWNGKTDFSSAFHPIITTVGEYPIVIKPTTSDKLRTNGLMIHQTDQISEPVWDLHRSAELPASSQGQLLSNLIGRGTEPTTLNVRLDNQLFAGKINSTSIKFKLDAWKSALCDGYKQLGSAPLADDAPFNVAGWGRAMKLARDATCTGGTKAFQGVACKKAARLLVEAYATGDAAPLQRAVDANCDASVARTTMETVAGDRLRKLLVAQQDSAADVFIGKIGKAPLPRWQAIATEAVSSARLARERDAFGRALSTCEFDATPTNCDEALRQATVATTDERARISAARTARVKFEAEVAAQRAAEEVAAKNARIETERRIALAQKQRKTMVPVVEVPTSTHSPCDDVYVGRRVSVSENGRHRFNGVVVGAGRNFATIAPDDVMVTFVGSSYKASCDSVGDPR